MKQIDQSKNPASLPGILLIKSKQFPQYRRTYKLPRLFAYLVNELSIIIFVHRKSRLKAVILISHVEKKSCWDGIKISASAQRNSLITQVTGRHEVDYQPLFFGPNNVPTIDK